MSNFAAASQAASVALVESARILREAGMLDACRLILEPDNAATIMDTAVADVRRVLGDDDLPQLLRRQVA